MALARAGFINPRSHLLQPFGTCRTLFLCCDIQEKLRHRIPHFQDAVDVSNKIAAFHIAATTARTAFVATAHFPEKVGPFVSDIKLPPGAPLVSKYNISMLVPEVVPYLDGDAKLGLEPVQQVVLWGHETHVCILQTADALLQRNVRVGVLVDGCGAQKTIDHKIALRAMEGRDGLTLTTFGSMMVQLAQSEESILREVIQLLK